MLFNKAKSILLVFALLIVGAITAQTASSHKGWSVHKPFEHDVFIENKGQFIEQVQKGVGQPILYSSLKGYIHIYFSPTALTFEYDSAYIADGDEKPGADDDANVKILPVFMQVTWDGANANAQVEVQKPVSDYFTYRNPNDRTGHSSVLAHAWGKIIYHNLYNNIDVAFYYSADKKGLEYDIIVHPGGDLSQVKMHYSPNANLGLIKRDLHIASPCANFIDREPNAKDEDGNTVQTSFSVNKNIVTFTTGDYDKSKILVIDPMFSTTTFSSTNKAYDLQYDLAGNVYIMGGGDATESQLQKYNAAGTLQWTYNCTFPYKDQNKYYYGGFTTDNRSGSSYIAEGLDYGGAGCRVVKINPAGGVVTTFGGDPNVNEIWRLSFDYCDNQLILGAGEGSTAVIQGGTMDTNCTAITSVNVLGAGAGSTHHDIAMITFDGVGKCYFATTKPAAPGNPGYDNVLLQMPSATLTPTAYQVPDRSLFIETASIPYYPSLVAATYYLYSGNGFNGLVADLNLVATYDGNKLRTWTPATGAIIDSVTVTPNTQLWGGIALDCEDNLYVGNQNQVSVYSSALGLINTITPTGSVGTDTLYDLHLSPSNILYACGNDYVSSTQLALPKMVTVVSPSTSCGCTGTATATVCDNYPYTYSWSNGQTTQTATGLCPGKYLVTIKDQSCNPRIDTASVVVSPGAGTLSATIITTPVKCFGQSNGTASVTVTGGTAPIVYSWSTGATASTINALAAGNYTCTVKDANGCTDTLKDSVQTPKPLTLKTTTFAATCSYKCDGQAIAVPNGGTNPYAYTWSGGGSGASVNNLCVGTKDSVTVTDAHGCIADTTVKITDPPPIVLTTDSTAALCGKTSGSAGIATISGGTPGYTYLWNTGATTSSISNINADVYQVIITDANKCNDTATITVPTIPGDSAKIIATVNELCFGGNNGSATATVWGGTTPYTYTWQTTAPVQTSLTATGLTAGTYTFSVTDANGCIYKTYATITQPTPVIVTVPPDTICIGQSATLTATASGGTPGYTYLWNNNSTGASFTSNATVTTAYNVQATDTNGCMSPVMPVTLVVRNPLIVVCGPKASMCPGGSVNLTATGAGGDNIYTYTWAPAAGLNVTTGVSVIASPTVSTTYTVTLKDACGTPQAVDSVVVTIYPTPVVNLIADTLQGCYPLCVTFKDLSTIGGGDSIVSWDWSFGDGNSSNSQNPSHCYTNPGVYTVSLTVTSNKNCSSSVTINNYITVYSHPVADFSLTPQPTNIMNPTIYFTDHSTDAYGIANWWWQYGDGTDTTGIVRNTQHTYGDTGNYCVTLTVTNIHGCVATTVNCLEISPFFVIYVPNAFTPNGNGVNELFTAKGVGIINYQMWIFDRWGQQIYYTTNLYGGWDGVVQGGASGTQAQEDTYVWLIEVTDVFHKDHRYIGRVTLIK